MEQPPTQMLLNFKTQTQDSKVMHTAAKIFQQQLRPKKAASGTRKPQKSSLQQNSNSLLNSTLMSMLNQKSGKTTAKIGKVDKNATHASITSSQKPQRSSSRAKSACRGKSELFNSTTPIKFFSNLEESIKDTFNRAKNGSKVLNQGNKDEQLANSQIIVISRTNQTVAQKAKKLMNSSLEGKNPNLNTTLYFNGTDHQNNFAEFTQSNWAPNESNGKINQLKKQINEIISKQTQDQTSQQTSKIKLKLQQKNRSSSSPSNERKSINQYLNQASDPGSLKLNPKNQTTLTTSCKDKLNTVAEFQKTSESSKRVSSNQRASIISKERFPSQAGLSASKKALTINLKKKQIMRGLLETQNAIQGQSVPGSSSKRKSVGRAANVVGSSQTKISSNINLNYGTNSFSKSRECITQMQVRQNNNYNSKCQSSYATNQSKSSSSLKQLPNQRKQKIANSLLLNSTAKQIAACHQFSRVEIGKINQTSKQNFQTTDHNYENHNAIEKKKIRSEVQIVSTSQLKSLNSSNRINLPKPNSKISIEDFGSQMGTCTASGPLNPFLEQILKELPSANMDSQPQATFKGNIASWNDSQQSQKSGKNTNISKKIRSNIEKQAQTKKQQKSVLNTFNLTTTSAALVNVSSRNSSLNAQNNLESIINKTQVSQLNMTAQHTAGATMGPSQKHQRNTSAGICLINQKIPTQKTSNNQIPTVISGYYTKMSSITNSKLNLTSKPADFYCNEENEESKQNQNQFTVSSKVSLTKIKGKPQVSNSIKRYKVSMVKHSQDFPKPIERSVNTSQPKADKVEKPEKVDNDQSNLNSVGGSIGKLLGLNNTMVGLNQVVANQSLLNVVKVAARQKESQKLKKEQNNAIVLAPQNTIELNSSQIKKIATKRQHFSLNNTQIIAEQLGQHKKKAQVQLTSESVEMGTEIHQLKQKSGGQNLTLSNTAISNLKHQLAQAKSSIQSKQSKNSEQKAQSLQQTQKLSFTQPRNSIKSRGKQQSQKRQTKQSNTSQFDWSSFLANLLQENLKPKKSTFGGQNQGSALYAKPYQIQNDLQNKTQPLPKNLIEKNSADAKDEKFSAYGNCNNYGFQYQRFNSRDSDQRPRIGNKQIEIAPPNGHRHNKLASTLQANHLARMNLEDKTINILTEVTESGDGEKDNSSTSIPSTHRSRIQVNEDFKFGKLLGEGAYAVVRLAYKKSEGKNYAAKIYDKSKLIDEHRRQSVCREVMLMQKLKHKYCVDFIEAFETDHYVYVIMEHVKGKSLHDYLKKQKAVAGKTEFDQTLDEQEAKRILKQLLEVLEYLHDEGITHRDIKLENILLDSENNVKLIDFGFSTCYKPQKKLKMFCGTPSYMAPEIVSRIEYFGPPADLWACGVLLFCLLNGYFPFKGQTDAELYRRIQRGSYKLIRNDLSDDCLSILKEFLNVNQESRQTASELLQENWFLSDSSKKRSHAEIRKQFKAKILSKFPLRSSNKTQICIHAPQQQSQQDNSNLTSSNTASNIQTNRVQQNIDLALHRQINQASPPSMPSDLSQQGTVNGWRQSVQTTTTQMRNRGLNQDSNELNQQVAQAYFNINTQTKQGIAPPSGKFTPAYGPDYRSDSPRIEIESRPFFQDDGAKVEDVEEEKVISEIVSIYSDKAINQSEQQQKLYQESDESDYIYMNINTKKIKKNNFIEEVADDATAAGVAYGAITIPSNKQ